MALQKDMNRMYGLNNISGRAIGLKVSFRVYQFDFWSHESVRGGREIGTLADIGN